MSNIDDTIPAEGDATTAGQRGNWSTAKGEITALEAHPPLDTANDDAHGARTYADAGDMAAVAAANAYTDTHALTALHVPPGGLTAQVLKKTSDSDYDTFWADDEVGAPGGGIVQGTPFVAGDIMAAESSAGAGSARTTGIAQITMTDHLGGGLTDAHQTSEIDGLDAALALKLENVVEDTTPELGGHLQTNGQRVEITDLGGASIQGALTISQNGAAFGYFDGTAFSLDDGSILVEPGRVELFGTTTVINGLKHANPAGRQVTATQDGVLYGVDPPPPGWFVADTDTTLYLRVGGVGVWQQLTGLEVILPQDIQLGDPIDIAASVFTREGSGNRSGTVEIGFGVNSVTPSAADASFPLSPGFEGYLAYSIRLTTITATAGDTVNMFVRVSTEDNPQFSANLEFDGTAGTDHEMSVGTPGGAPGSPGDVVQGTPVGVDGDVALWVDAAQKVLASTQVQWTNVARRDVANTLSGHQTLDEVDIVFREAAAQQGRMTSSAGTFTIAGTSSPTFAVFDRNVLIGGSQIAINTPGGLVMSGTTGGAQGDGTINAKVLAQEQIPIVYPTDRLEAGTTVALDFAATKSPRVVCTAATAITLTPPTGEGELAVIIANDVSVDTSAFGANVRNADPGGALRTAYVYGIDDGGPDQAVVLVWGP